MLAYLPTVKRTESALVPTIPQAIRRGKKIIRPVVHITEGLHLGAGLGRRVGRAQIHNPAQRTAAKQGGAGPLNHFYLRHIFNRQISPFYVAGIGAEQWHVIYQHLHPAARPITEAARAADVQLSIYHAHARYPLERIVKAGDVVLL